jgi:hypothetical protein
MNETLEYLMSQIEERRKAIIESLGDGAAKDFGSYQQSVGMVRGLLTAQSLIADLAKRMEKMDE